MKINTMKELLEDFNYTPNEAIKALRFALWCLNDETLQTRLEQHDDKRTKDTITCYNELEKYMIEWNREFRMFYEDESKFKRGDKVEIDGQVGTVICKNRYKLYGVEFEKEIGLHDCYDIEYLFGRGGKYGHCVWAREQDMIKVS